jgi:hypothetical protein
MLSAKGGRTMPSEKAQKLCYRLVREDYPDEEIIRRTKVGFAELIVLRAMLAVAPAPWAARNLPPIH